MPRIVRPMEVESDDRPKIDTRSKCLGVREPADRHADVDVDDATGIILMNRKGLSVTNDWRTLPGHLIPKHLDDGFNNARGKGMRVFVHGSGAFEEGRVSAKLDLLHKAGTIVAGVIAPSTSMPLGDFQQALADTRPDWFIDES